MPVNNRDQAMNATRAARLPAADDGRTFAHHAPRESRASLYRSPRTASPARTKPDARRVKPRGQQAQAARAAGVTAGVTAGLTAPAQANRFRRQPKSSPAALSTVQTPSRRQQLQKVLASSQTWRWVGIVGLGVAGACLLATSPLGHIGSIAGAVFCFVSMAYLVKMEVDVRRARKAPGATSAQDVPVPGAASAQDASVPPGLAQPTALASV